LSLQALHPQTPLFLIGERVTSRIDFFRGCCQYSREFFIQINGGQMILVIGEVLVDVFPSYQRIGGAPFNFAFHLQQLGYPVRFVTRVGNDHKGQEIIDLLLEKGFDRNDIQTDLQRPTGVVRVTLDGKGVPDFSIIENTAYDHLDLDRITHLDPSKIEMIYFGSLIQRTAFVRRQVERFLRQKTLRDKRFCDLNLRPPHVSLGAVDQSLRNTDFLKLNEEEMDFVHRHFVVKKSKGSDPIEEIMQWFDISMVALTRGANGSTFYRDRHTPIDQPAAENVRIVDTVGAGDGFASILAAGYLKKLSWETILFQASLFSSRICGIPGAIPDDEKFYDEFRIVKKNGYTFTGLK
jgi:fructokinase